MDKYSFNDQRKASRDELLFVTASIETEDSAGILRTEFLPIEIIEVLCAD